MSTAAVPELDMNKLNAFLGQFVSDLGAAVSQRHGRDRRKTWPLQSAGGRAHQLDAAGAQDRH